MLNKSRTIAVVAAIGILAAGCGGTDNNESEHAKGKPGKVDTTSKVPSGPTKGIKDPRGDIKSLQGFKCAPDSSGQWAASGTLKNGAKETKKFLVSASVVKVKGNEVLGAIEKTYEVAPGKSQKVELAKVFVDAKQKTGKGRLCVPRVVSGT